MMEFLAELSVLKTVFDQHCEDWRGCVKCWRFYLTFDPRPNEVDP